MERTSEIADSALSFPISVAGRLRPFRTADFLGLLAGVCQGCCRLRVLLRSVGRCCRRAWRFRGLVLHLPGLLSGDQGWLERQGHRLGDSACAGSGLGASFDPVTTVEQLISGLLDHTVIQQTGDKLLQNRYFLEQEIRSDDSF